MTIRVLMFVTACWCLVATACSETPTAPDGPGSADPPGIATAGDIAFCRDETNRYRPMRGRAAVSLADDLVSRAQAAADADHASNTPHGYFRSHPVAAENEVLRWSFGGGGSVRQVIGQAIAGFWSEGPGGGHYENLTGPFSELGCGVAVGGSAITIVQVCR